MYEVVFTNFRTHMDMVSKVTAESLLSCIMSTIESGKWALTELRPIEETAKN